MRKKRKRISWSPSVDMLQNTEHPPRKKYKNTEISLTPRAERFANNLDRYLRLSLVNLIICQLEEMNEEELRRFMKHTKYRLFDWALENKKLFLVTCLLGKLTDSTAFAMLNHNDYASLRCLIRTNTQDNSIAILEIILERQPRSQIKEIIGNYFPDLLSNRTAVKDQKSSFRGIDSTVNNKYQGVIFATKEISLQKTAHHTRMLQSGFD